MLERALRWIANAMGDLRNTQEFPPGHYHSPIPSVQRIREDAARIFGTPPSIPGVDLNEEEQLRLLEEFREYYREIPFGQRKREGMRYYFDNPYYSWSDAIFLYSMIRHAKPNRIIEVGAGHSSCVILDTNELHFRNAVRCTFIDPFPDRFLSLIRQSDMEKVELLAKEIRDVPAGVFRSLAGNDILVVDSTHISKAAGDVNHLLFEVLPTLGEGVYIHFHDIFYPFEYPKEWILGGRSWNEAYILRAFLQYNRSFKIVFFNTYLQLAFRSRFEKEFPLCMKNPGGSIWLKKC
jgi:hypothetical protein